MGINNLARKIAKTFAHINVISSYSFSFLKKEKGKIKII
jgi:hypothetical protein